MEPPRRAWSDDLFTWLICRRLVHWPETAFEEITSRFPQGDFLGTWRKARVVSEVQKRLFQLCLSRGQTLFPLVVRQLAQIRPIGPHGEQIRVRLIAGTQHRFVLPSHPAAGKDVPFSVSRPRSMRIVAAVMSETLYPRAVGPDRVNFEVAVAKAGKCNQVPSSPQLGKSS